MAPVGVMLCRELPPGSLDDLAGGFGLSVRWVRPRDPIPASFWGEPEAGLRGSCLFVRPDTPVHSALHECCHYICMDGDRRAHLVRDAGGDEMEEVAVCYLQVVLCDWLPGIDRARLFADMDEWGYSFRLRTAEAWFTRDSDDARRWLTRHGLLDAAGRPTGAVRP